MELFDLVDENDNVIGTTDRLTAHGEGLPHRVAAVFVFNADGELYVQVHISSGGKYDHSVGGHVMKGEDYATAAKREAREELGIEQPLTHVVTFYSGGPFRHMFGVFECVVDDNWKFVPNNEVNEIIPMKIEDIRRLMNTNPEKLQWDL